MRGINSFKATLLVAFALLICCQGYTPKAYVEKYEKSKRKYGYTLDNGNVGLTVSYQPSEYFAAKELLFDTTMKTKDAVARYKNGLFFTADFIWKDKGLFRSVKKTVAPASFDDTRGISDKKDVFLLAEKDTVQVLEFQHDKNLSSGDEDVYLLAFDKNRLKHKVDNCHLFIRNASVDLGTVDVDLHKIVKSGLYLRGK